MRLSILSRASVSVLLALLCHPAYGGAQVRPTPVSPEAPVALDASAELGDIAIDGVIDEPQWASGRVFRGFTQREPVEGEPAENDTEVRVLFGEGSVWIAARMWDAEPESIVARLSRRDNEGEHDEFAVLLDPDLDGLTGYGFVVSAANVQRDVYFFEDDREDGAWDAVWESDVRIDAQGWTAEMRIPLAQIRYEASEEPQSWGVNFYRRRIASNEEAHYSLVSGLRRGNVSQWARTDGVLTPRSARRLEVVPYVVSSLHRGPSVDGDPFFDGTAADARIGADVSYGLGAAFTLDATINPDFGQVEADPAVINLSAFETFFEERRPFFVEDARVFDFGLSAGGRLFYSRRVGRAPQGRAPSGALFTELPSNATILGATKLTGRTSNGLTLGALAALTGSEHGDGLFPGNVTTDFLVEPRAEFGAASLVKDFRGGASQVGVLGTVLSRDLPSDGSCDWLPTFAFNGGVRFNHQFAGRAWAVFGYLSGSHVSGDEAAITRIQRSSVHYFQRPDATRFAVDSTATSITGRDWRLTLEKRNGEHWTGSIWAAEVTKGFEVNDLGFSTRTEVLDGGVQITYREIRPGRLFRNYNVGFRSFHNWSHEALDDTWSVDSWQNARTNGNYNFQASGQFLNYWGASVGFGYQLDQVNRRHTRGGPMMLIPGTNNLQASFFSDSRKAVVLGVFLGANTARRGFSRARSVAVELGVRPSDNLSLSFSPSFGWFRSGDQYVTATGAPPYAPTYGTRYLFADLEQRQFSMEARVDWTFSPTLTLQVFAQPLLSSGDFLRYKQLAAAKSYDFTVLTPTQAGSTLSVDFDGDAVSDFSFTDRDFNVRSLIGNAVLRWEYRPGSTVFLVWQRTQDDQVGIGDFDLSRDAGALFRAPADDRLILKVNYWLGL
ncbi:MAG: hypothetical protein FJ207_03935 [Gemmatimonadetes bacterium]|nr:hypothetical protein [Gemmatimonadota bacterium]